MQRGALAAWVMAGGLFAAIGGYFSVADKLMTMQLNCRPVDAGHVYCIGISPLLVWVGISWALFAGAAFLGLVKWLRKNQSHKWAS